ncbi:type VI secretion system protein TssL, partial [Mesorhizobium sp. M2A.F.Ca.ET.029.05.1.1]
LAAIVVAAAAYVGLSMGLSSQAVELSALVRTLPPASRGDVTRAAPKQDAPEPEAPQPVDFALLPEFKAEAPDDLKGALSGTESVSLAKLIIQSSNPELFQSSRPTLTEGYEPLIASIAKVILDNKELIGKITVVGHTDNVRLQKSNPLASNQRLSEARAETIAKLLAQAGVPPESISSEGRAETDPVADNSTREGRALNRRVEVLVEKRL